MLAQLPVAILVLCVVGATINDLWKFEIADSWSIAIVAAFVAQAMMTDQSPLWSHAVAPVALFAVLALLFAKGWMGGGDVKLMTAIAVWTGLGGLPAFLVGTMLGGGILACTLLVARVLPLPASAPRLLKRDAPLPYAVAIAAGTAWWMFGLPV